MRHAFATAVLVAVLGLFAGVRQAAAQFAPDQRVAPGTFAPTGAQSGEVRNARAATHRRHKAHKHHVVRSPPNQRKAVERNEYKRVSDLVNFPELFPGLGIIFVKPETLPFGPFLCFHRRDRLVATVYMIPIKDIDDHKSMEAVGYPAAGPVDHVTHLLQRGPPRRGDAALPRRALGM